MHLRTATMQDLSALRQLEQAVVEAERPYNTQIKSSQAIYYDIPALIQSPDSLLLVGELNQRIAATGYLQIRQSKRSLKHPRHGYLGFMYVDERERGKGLNQQLITALIEWGQSQGVENYYLDVYPGNQSAIKAYEKLGFAPSLLEMRLDV